MCCIGDVTLPLPCHHKRPPRDPHRLVGMVLGIDSENPGRTDQHVVDVRGSRAHRNSVEDGPFGAKPGEQPSHRHFAQGAPVPRAGLGAERIGAEYPSQQ
ncbi:hypothetical protein D9M72_620830 [compost metagenome]